jgi:hypothetical protein
MQHQSMYAALHAMPFSNGNLRAFRKQILQGKEERIVGCLTSKLLMKREQ